MYFLETKATLSCSEELNSSSSTNVIKDDEKRNGQEEQSPIFSSKGNPHLSPKAKLIWRCVRFI